MKLDSLNSLFEEQLKDLHAAESDLIKALPKVADQVSSPTLREAVEKHLEETERHVERLETIASNLGIKKLKGKKCPAMEGLIKESQEALKAKGDPAVKDAAIIAAAQRIEHYEIAAYGTARAFAEELGNEDAASLLAETLQEEEQTDERLTEIAEGEVNPNTLKAGEEEEEEQGNGRRSRLSGAGSERRRGRGSSEHMAAK